MCLSFIHKAKDVIVAMNFDNNGMKYSINTKDPNQFIVLVESGRGKYPSFGINGDGVFVNNLIVNSNGKGLYRRASKKVTHTSKLVTDIINGTIIADGLEGYLQSIEVVNTPDWSTHNMICDSHANVWVVEPGRGNIYSPATASSFFVMTNFSLWDYKNEDIDCECTRYLAASNALVQSDEMNVEEAFRILESAKQAEGEWTTDFSMVYSKNKHTLYYCLDGNFKDRLEYVFPSA
jgi:hypothetical protein